MKGLDSGQIKHALYMKVELALIDCICLLEVEM